MPNKTNTLERTPEVAVLPLAGSGTRMFPATTAIEKAMMPIYEGDQAVPVVQRMVDEAAKAGIENILIVTTRRGETQLRDYFGKINPDLMSRLKNPNNREKLEAELARRESLNVDYIIQSSDPVGREKYGNAIPLYVARAALKGVNNFVLLGGDDFIHREDGTSELAHAIDTWNRSGADHAMVGSPVDRADAPKYGILRVDEHGRLLEVDEKPPLDRVPENPIMSDSRYLLGHEVWEPLHNTILNPNPPKGEYYMVTAINEMLQEGQTIIVHVAEGEYFDMGSAKGSRHASNRLTELALRS